MIRAYYDTAYLLKLLRPEPGAAPAATANSEMRPAASGRISRRSGERQ